VAIRQGLVGPNGLGKPSQEQQDVVLKDAQQLNLDSLYQLPPIGTWPPAEDGSGDGA